MNGIFDFHSGASTVSGRVDVLLIFMTILCAGVALAVICTMAYFAVRYRAGSAADRSSHEQGTVGIEFSWSVLPLIAFLGIFAWSIRLFATIETPPADADPVYVVARQWMWKLQHTNGVREINELHVPLGRAQRLVMISEDVIHSFFVPDFRVKQDVLPGRYTQLWFTATRTGTYHLFCAEYCGAFHSQMGGAVVVQTPADYARWLAGHRGGESLASRGAALFRAYGCSGCHTPGSSVRAPPLRDLYAHPVQLSDGSTVTADEAYFRDSVLLPQKQVVAGYQPVMPSFAEQISEDDMLALVEWFRAGAAP